jgi:hypothetical protein
MVLLMLAIMLLHKSKLPADWLQADLELRPAICGQTALCKNIAQKRFFCFNSFAA